MDKEKILLVEGVNDREVVYRIENAYSLRDICIVKDSGSIDNAKMSFDLYVNENASKVSVLGIIVDADQSCVDRWISIRNILIATDNYQVPDNMPEVGLILEPTNSDTPRVGLWIMPNNREEGMLEDFLLALTSTNDTLLKYVDTTLQDLHDKGLQRFADVHKVKARIHTYLSWQEDPECTLATAVVKHYFDTNAELAKKFADWMKRLFQ